MITVSGGLLMVGVSLLLGGAYGYEKGYKTYEKISDEYKKDLRIMIEKAIQENDGKLLEEIKNNWHWLA